MRNPRHNLRRSRRAGFALLVTLTLLAFILVLLVGLATYTRIETAIAGNRQRQAQARENALLALDVAIAQLQRHAGDDRRVTASAASFGAADGARHYTGVWASATESREPLTWLVSGNEAQPLAVHPTSPPENSVELVGHNTSGLARDVVAPLIDLAATRVAGFNGATTIGRYAWWVGDSGIKAPVAVSDRLSDVGFAPYDSAELRSRLPQQIGVGAGPTEFEPRALANASLIDHTVNPPQLALLKSSDDALIGTAKLRENFHAWTTDNRAVLGDTRSGGLRQDLSVRADLLGPDFERWVDYDATMETSTAPVAPAPVPAYGSDPLRRRYRITPSLSANAPGIAPILTYFYLLIGVRKQNATSPFTLSVRWAAALWNPFTSALVPEDLRLEISGLPDSLDFIDANTNLVNASASLAQLYGDPLKVTLPWVSAASPTKADQQSWLPGRVYNWVNLHDAPFASGGDNPGRFSSRDLGGFADGLLQPVPGSAAVNGNTPLSIRLNANVTLTVKLVRGRDGAVLATYRSPTYDAVSATAPDAANRNKSQLGFLFRLAESFDTVTNPSLWLTTESLDPRDPSLSPAALRAVPNGPNPAAYVNYVTLSAPDRLFDRDITRGTSYNEDVPLFELPRAPLLSLGELQHFFVPGARPFAIGNSWGEKAHVHGIRANELFDRFYFSGLTPRVAAAIPPHASLPNLFLRPVERVAAAELAAGGNPMSARYLLQHAAFNVNSTHRAAWAAVLRGGRAANGDSFSYLDASAATGTAADDARRRDEVAGARFFRFPQSAQEVFKADDGYAQSTTSATATGPIINTPLFRRGVRALSTSEVEALARAIAENIASKHTASGPFRSLEEFLNPTPALGGASVIEKAIADARLNGAIAEFSSQWLTQADVMGLLAPFVFPRSDTFLVRAYGEVVNPATSATEGRAWCEALVQRVPEYFDPGDAPETPPLALTRELNQTYGRRFRVTTFRWLTRSDI